MQHLLQHKGIKDIKLITAAFIYPIFFVDSCHKFTHNVDLHWVHSVTLGINKLLRQLMENVDFVCVYVCTFVYFVSLLVYTHTHTHRHTHTHMHRDVSCDQTCPCCNTTRVPGLGDWSLHCRGWASLYLAQGSERLAGALAFCWSTHCVLERTSQLMSF